MGHYSEIIRKRELERIEKETAKMINSLCEKIVTMSYDDLKLITLAIENLEKIKAMITLLNSVSK